MDTGAEIFEEETGCKSLDDFFANPDVEGYQPQIDKLIVSPNNITMQNKYRHLDADGWVALRNTQYQNFAHVQREITKIQDDIISPEAKNPSQHFKSKLSLQQDRVNIGDVIRELTFVAVRKRTLAAAETELVPA